jgi:S1-C subfamily serine protease
MFSCVSRHAVPLILFCGTLSSGGFFALLCLALLKLLPIPFNSRLSRLRRSRSLALGLVVVAVGNTLGDV